MGVLKRNHAIEVLGGELRYASPPRQEQRGGPQSPARGLSYSSTHHFLSLGFPGEGGVGDGVVKT
jgi:hypothetical protein